MSINPEIGETRERLRQAAERIAEQASTIKEVADQLRDDVDALTERIAAIENKGANVAQKLVASDKRIRVEQGQQDSRLDTLEENGNDPKG